MAITWDRADEDEREFLFFPVLQDSKSEDIYGLALVITGNERRQYARVGHFHTMVEGLALREP